MINRNSIYHPFRHVIFFAKSKNNLLFFRFREEFKEIAVMTSTNFIFIPETFAATLVFVELYLLKD